MTCDRKVSLRIDRATMDLVRQAAKARHMSASAWIKEAIREGMEVSE